MLRSAPSSSDALAELQAYRRARDAVCVVTSASQIPDAGPSADPSAVVAFLRLAVESRLVMTVESAPQKWMKKIEYVPT